MTKIELIKNLIDNVRDIFCCYQVKQYGNAEISTIIIGEKHNNAIERCLQRNLVKMFNPEYALIEDNIHPDFDNWEHEYNLKIVHCDAEKLNTTAIRENKMGEIIIDHVPKTTKPVIVIIGHTHARYESKIHQVLKGHVNYICIWNEAIANKEIDNEQEIEKVTRRRDFNSGSGEGRAGSPHAFRLGMKA